ncbi:MAG: metal ABC transporter substrate-binding protein [Polaromonas sp.]|uniref:metal ABC transporter substrate-binding protein n=1 Tax=Polaromonas sp. TaxID=1869339 RepID=UPI00180AEE55|nr:metal ABC transporter substrate-binding protein [Polaromonas sp.]NMM11141.1 metal ABC transporter substrate-binding protein [Polaromonas sp.]
MNFLSRLGPAILAITWACSALAEGKLPVVASFSVLGDLVRVVGGERVDVQTLVGPDQDAHVFEPSPSDVKKVAQSRLLVSNGLGFDSWMDKLARSAAYKGTVVVASSGVLTKKSAEENGHDDPHAWQDPTKVITYVRNISAALAKADPSGAAIYQRNASAYQAELVQLDSWAKVQFALIPLAKRKIITSHDAFGYLGARYQISFLAPQGVSTDSEASAKEVALLIRQIKREKIKAVHVENMTNTRLLEQLSREAGVTAGATLYSDALSAQGGPADSYLKMMHYNITQLVQSMKLN